MSLKNPVYLVAAPGFKPGCIGKPITGIHKISLVEYLSGSEFQGSNVLVVLVTA